MLYQNLLARHKKEKCEMTFGIRLAFVLIVVGLLSANSPAQVGGGSTSGGATKPPVNRRSTTTPSTRTTSVGTSAKVTRPAPPRRHQSTANGGRAATALATPKFSSGRKGATVYGVITYADGRTGTVKGTMAGKRLQMNWTNSSGEVGSGWLELSWNNFLGGPWRSATVRDGSWTLMRVEGKWCFGGSRNRMRTVTHNARGVVSVVDEYGDNTGGDLEGPWLYLESDGMRIKGETDFRANRINWSTGFFWTWCGRN